MGIEEYWDKSAEELVKHMGDRVTQTNPNYMQAQVALLNYKGAQLNKESADKIVKGVLVASENMDKAAKELPKIMKSQGWWTAILVIATIAYVFATGFLVYLNYINMQNESYYREATYQIMLQEFIEKNISEESIKK